MNKNFNQLIQKLKEELGFFLSIGFGVFLFVLFFQPFPLVSSDFNNSLLIIAGLGAIIFLFIVIVRIILPWLLVSDDQENKKPLFLSYFHGFMIFVLSTLAFAFYIRYVGSVDITFYISFKIIIICLVPPVIIGLYDSFRELKLHNELLIVEKKIIQKQVIKFEEDILNKSVEFISENNSETFSLPVGEVAFIKSADNYVEIVYREDDNFKKKLIRNTLKNIEFQLKQFSNFARCHRICIVNIYFVEKLNRNSGNHWLTIKGLKEQLPVSRQYLLKIKDLL